MKTHLFSSIASIAAATAALGANIQITSSAKDIPMPNSDGSFSKVSSKGYSIRHIYYIISEAEYTTYTNAASPTEAVYNAFLVGELGEACLYDEIKTNGYSNINLEDIFWYHDDAKGQDVNYDKYYGNGVNAYFAAIYTYTNGNTGAFYYIAQPTNIVTLTDEEINASPTPWDVKKRITNIAINGGCWEVVSAGADPDPDPTPDPTPAPGPEPDPVPTYTIYFIANGGSGSMPGQVATNGVSARLSANKFKKTGCTFLGWAKSKSGKVAYANGASVKNLAKAGGNASLYARWAVTKYSVKFSANAKGVTGKMAAQSMSYGTAAKLRKNAFTRKGWLFLGWAVKKDGAVAYKNTEKVKNLRTDGKVTTLYAVWAKKTYKVAFYGTYKGVTGKMAAQTMTYGKSKKLSANKFKRKGYVFAGWATSAANAKKGIVKYKNKKAVLNLTANGSTVKLYAVWKKK